MLIQEVYKLGHSNSTLRYPYRVKMEKGKVKLIKDPNKGLSEKWSAKYKKSIDCSNPKGFSQKAHCAGKKK
jgi:hypothetical protein